MPHCVAKSRAGEKVTHPYVGHNRKLIDESRALQGCMTVGSVHSGC